MISDLLDYAGITFGKIRSIPENIDPYAPVRAAVDTLCALAQAAEVRIVDSFEDVVLRVDADPARLQQITMNLLSNAVKFSPRGSTIHLSAGRSADNFSLRVVDQGIGIESQFLPKIFERFSQQDATITKSHGGLGLGLAIVKQLVELHGGSIEASSGGKGQGSTFTVTIPLSDQNTASSSSDSQTLRTMDYSRVVVLLVEDDADSRALTARVLADVGATVLEAGSADAAIDHLKNATPTILISDIGMAKIDGYELLRRLRETGYDAAALPAIALTAFSRMEDRSQALKAGFQEHLVKPLDPQMLISRVSALSKPGRKAN
jgi:CheY-like chemotaxis protein/anti-sigma regulatory factor (Ser/Thr protein kinase)